MKPTSLMIKDGKRSIIEAINSTQLPPCIIKLILQDINIQIDRLCIEEEKEDTKKYQEELEEQEKNKKGE